MIYRTFTGAAIDLTKVVYIGSIYFVRDGRLTKVGYPVGMQMSEYFKEVVVECVVSSEAAAENHGKASECQREIVNSWQSVVDEHRKT